MRNHKSVAAKAATIALSVAMVSTPVFAEYESALQKKTDEYAACYIGNAIVYMENHKDDTGKVSSVITKEPITQKVMAQQIASTKCKKFYPKIANTVEGDLMFEDIDDYTNQIIWNIFKKSYPEAKETTENESKTESVTATAETWKPEFIEGCFVDNAVQQENPIIANKIENYYSTLPKGACVHGSRWQKGH